MILLLAADYQDARRWDDATQLDEDAILIVELGDVHACAKRVTPGARIVVTDRCSPTQGVISALQALHAPDRRLPATRGPIRYYHGE